MSDRPQHRRESDMKCWPLDALFIVRKFVMSLSELLANRFGCEKRELMIFYSRAGSNNNRQHLDVGGNYGGADIKGELDHNELKLI